MSGIFGIVHKDGMPVTSQALAPIQQAMRPWAVDGFQCWCHGPVGFGHLRLQVTPESFFEQLPRAHPIWSDWVTITADARIDNRRALMDALGVLRSERAAVSDSLLILQAYERWGVACIERLIGAFAFAIWDGRCRTLVCGRDILGLRPLLYYDSPRFIVFASDIKGILAHPEVPQKLNQPLLAARLQQTTYFAEKRLTYYEGIVKVPPAHRLSVSARRTQLSQYWSPEVAPDVRFASADDYVERMRELLEQAVHCRLRTAYPVGSHLSGGLDSSGVTLLASRQLHERGRRLTAFSWSPPPEPGEPLDDERADVEAIRRREAIDCHYHAVTESDVMDMYGRDFTVEPTAMLCHEAHVQFQASRKGIRVMLSGWGGDEVATYHGGGYLAELLASGRWGELHHRLRMRSSVPGGAKWQVLKRYVSLLYHAGVIPLLPDVLYRCVDPFGLNAPLPWACINPDFAHRYRDEVCALRGHGYRERAGVRLSQSLRLNLGYLTRRVEDWAISGARSGLEYRYPLLDQRLLAFCLGMPAEHYCRDGLKRYILRRALGNTLPESLRSNASKREAANLKALRRAVPNGLLRLLMRIEPRESDPPVARFVNIAQLKEVLQRKDERALRGGVIGHTLACLNVRVITEGG